MGGYLQHTPLALFLKVCQLLLVLQVVKAVANQLSKLNTNARYLHSNLVQHAEMIADTMPDPLEVKKLTFTLPMESHLLLMNRLVRRRRTRRRRKGELWLVVQHWLAPH